MSRCRTGAGELDGAQYDVLGGRETTGVELLREVEHGLDEALRQKHAHPPHGVARTARQTHEAVVVVQQRTPEDLSIKRRPPRNTFMLALEQPSLEVAPTTSTVSNSGLLFSRLRLCLAS